jgi:hypothetical protein
MADECRDEDSQANTPGLDTIIQRLFPPNKKLKRDATQAELNASKPAVQYRRQRKKGSQLEAFADIIEDGNRESRLGREAMGRHFERSKPEAIQVQTKLFDGCPGLDGLLGKAQWKALLAYMKEDDGDVDIPGGQLYLNTAKDRIRDELMEEFVGCARCDIVALEGKMGVYP